MAQLICEIWQDDEYNSVEAAIISEGSDRLRKTVSPNATLLHTYIARSSFEVFQGYNDWFGWEWKPTAGVAEYFFTEAEAEEQRQYLAIRDINTP